ncbi:deoxyuridine 5'-triphosphate nucleotidohydrolase [bacterium BMS3Abin15]|nr:deoxyuridine 5'-triphosphate nucleotidohydrolase [bacterium BMS3Abin15]HDH07786.1 dUTP diphosphatase [Candidatus Moranbacteria bacterium]HDZ85882.1 dUTP diphosphatase [Candidatus Moranbacteria bacterium]
MKIEIKKLDPDAILPVFAHPGDAGLDLYSIENIELKPGDRMLCGTGIGMKIPDNYTGLIWDRSGLAVKEGIISIAGVVDSGYRGEIKVALVNLGQNSYEIKRGEKIAQMIIQKFEKPEFIEADKWDDKETSRGEGSFGSTGTN